VSSVADHERIREIVKRLDEIHRESELLRAKIEQIRASTPQWPLRPQQSPLFDDVPRSSAEYGRGHSDDANE